MPIFYGLFLLFAFVNYSFTPFEVGVLLFPLVISK